MLEVMAYDDRRECMDCNEEIAPGDAVYCLSFLYVDTVIELCPSCLQELHTAAGKRLAHSTDVD